MSEPTDHGVVHAYAREAVEEYLRAVATERAELERLIAEARERTARAKAAAERSATLERRVGAHIVSAHARVRVRRNDATATAERLLRASATTVSERHFTGEDGTGTQTGPASARGGPARVAPPPESPASVEPEGERSPWDRGPEQADEQAPPAPRLVAVPDRRADDFFEQLRAAVDDGAPLGPAMRPAWMVTHG